MKKKNSQPRIELDPEVIADLEIEDTSSVKGGASGSVGSRIRSGGVPTSSSASMT